MASPIPANAGAAVRASNNFAFAMYKELCKKEGDKNFFFSPMSITAALAMTHLGAAGSTADEIKAALFHNMSHPKRKAKDLANEDLLSAFSYLNEKLNTKKGSACVLRLANRFFVRKNLAVKETFTAATRKHYAAEAQLLDFEDTENSRTVINKWVEEQTNQKIKDLLKPGIINNMTAMVLINAIYFKGGWLENFDRKLTSKKAWVLPSKEKTQVDIMFRDDYYKFSRSEEFQGTMYLEVPYKGKELSMGIILPRSVDDLGVLQEKMDAECYKMMVNMASSLKLKLYMPKFKIETEASLKDMLQTLGITQAFRSTADFSNIAESNDLYLSEVVHKAFVDVNEEGTEAAAATAVMYARCEPTEFRATHPFIFVIKENLTGAIIFMGHVMNPNE